MFSSKLDDHVITKVMNVMTIVMNINNQYKSNIVLMMKMMRCMKLMNELIKLLIIMRKYWTNNSCFWLMKSHEIKPYFLNINFNSSGLDLLLLASRWFEFWEEYAFNHPEIHQRSSLYWNYSWRSSLVVVAVKSSRSHEVFELVGTLQ
jgi:hypothetical protein